MTQWNVLLLHGKRLSGIWILFFKNCVSPALLSNWRERLCLRVNHSSTNIPLYLIKLCMSAMDYLWKHKYPMQTTAIGSQRPCTLCVIPRGVCSHPHLEQQTKGSEGKHSWCAPVVGHSSAQSAVLGSVFCSPQETEQGTAGLFLATAVTQCLCSPQGAMMRTMSPSSGWGETTPCMASRSCGSPSTRWSTITPWSPSHSRRQVNLGEKKAGKVLGYSPSHLLSSCGLGWFDSVLKQLKPLADLNLTKRDEQKGDDILLVVVRNSVRWKSTEIWRFKIYCIRLMDF